jgi:hypothetical protein
MILRLASAFVLVAQAAAAQPKIITLDENTAVRRDAETAQGQIVNEQESEARPVVHLRGLDTLDGETDDIDLAVGETVTYGYLEITAESCRVPASDPEGDAWAFLRIRDAREEEPRFAGWMFASSPALSALDHPRYDIWVLSCSNR